MKKTLCILLFALLIGSALFAKETIKIGVNMGLSGNGAVSILKPIQNALLMEEKELNARSNAPYHYKLIFEDNQWTPRGSVMATQRMISLNNVDALITLADYAMGPIVHITRDKKIANLGYAWGVDKADGQYNFIFGDSELGYAQAFYSAVKNSPLKTGILSVRQSATPRFVDELQRLAKADGKSEFPITFINTESVDFRTVILRLNKEDHLEQLIMMLYGDDLNKFMYQMEQSDFRPAFVMMGNDIEGSQINRKILLARGTVVASCSLLDDVFPKAYKAYTHEDSTTYAGFGYDTLKLISESIESAPPSKLPMRERIAEALAAKKTFLGVSGSYTQKNGVFDTFPKLYRLTATGEEPFVPPTPPPAPSKN